MLHAYRNHLPLQLGAALFAHALSGELAIYQYCLLYAMRMERDGASGTSIKLANLARYFPRVPYDPPGQALWPHFLSFQSVT